MRSVSTPRRVPCDKSSTDSSGWRRIDRSRAPRPGRFLLGCRFPRLAPTPPEIRVGQAIPRPRSRRARRRRGRRGRSVRRGRCPPLRNRRRGFVRAPAWSSPSDRSFARGPSPGFQPPSIASNARARIKPSSTTNRMACADIPADVRPSFLECTACSKKHEVRLMNTCDCGAPLFARYDWKDLAVQDLASRRDLWRYAPLLPLEETTIRSRGEGGTPLYKLESIGTGGRVARLRVAGLYVKDEGLNPTRTFKARGMAVAVPMASSLGATTLAVPTAGNAGAALAAYAATYGVRAMAPFRRRASGRMRAACESLEGRARDGGTLAESADGRRRSPSPRDAGGPDRPSRAP